MSDELLIDDQDFDAQEDGAEEVQNEQGSVNEDDDWKPGERRGYKVRSKKTGKIYKKSSPYYLRNTFIKTLSDYESYWKTRDPYSTTNMRLLERFCEEYIASGYNPAVAAIRLGVHKTKAQAWYSRMMMHPEFERMMEVTHNRYLAKLRIKAERVVAELAKIAFASIGDFLETTEDGSVRVKRLDSLSRDDLAAISELVQRPGTKGAEIKIKLHDKMVALDRLGKYFGLFDDRGVGASVLGEVAALEEDVAIQRILEIAKKLEARVERADAKKTRGAN